MSAECQGDGGKISRIAELRHRLFRIASKVCLAARYLTEEAELSDDDSMIAVVIAEAAAELADAATELAELHGDLEAGDTPYTGHRRTS